MTTDEVQQTDPDEEASEEGDVETVILGSVTGEFDKVAPNGPNTISTVEQHDGGAESPNADDQPEAVDAETDEASTVDADAGALPDLGEDPGATEAAQQIDDEAYLEMRQVAGLTAGSMMKLPVGRAFEFNESNEGGSFSLRVLETGEVVVHPGSARAVIDEVEVSEPMLIGDALLNVSSACFSVRRPRPPASSESRMELVGAAFASISAVHVPPIGVEEPLPPDQLTGSRLGTIINRNPLTRGSVGPDAWAFLQSIRQTRSVVAERHRLMHPDPEELKTRLSRLDPGLWERSTDHSLFGRFGVGYANIPWEPRFDNPELIPEVLHEPIVEMSLLPWVPVTANLLYGPLGIVGKRAARMAACRHAILSLAALSMPGEIQFAIRSGKNTATSWNWTRALPPIMTERPDSSYVVTVVDGADGARAEEAARRASFEEAADADDPEAGVDATEIAEVVDITEVSEVSDPSLTAEHPAVVIDADTDLDDLDLGRGETGLSPGYIILADSLEELTRPCGSVLQIEPDGTGSVTNHLNETIQVTPIGVTEAFAHDMATRIADILTDSFL